MGPPDVGEAGASASLPDELCRASRWLRDAALPLWSSAGFDAVRGAFHEQLDFSLTPLVDRPSRLMVQARQISVFCSAALSGRFAAGEEPALTAAQNMIDRYESVDGLPGWVFSRREDGSLDPLRDLYAHAFVLFGLSWAIRLAPRRSFLDAIERTVSFIEANMRDAEHGGYWDSLPLMDALRRQNPHMHLFEAFIALHEATGESRFLVAGEKLRELMVSQFLAREGGALREYFSQDWTVHPAQGAGSVEPGHLFEWSWLLTRYETFSGKDQSNPIGRLMAMALRHGLDKRTGRIIDEITEDGRPVRTSSRSWPHAEALKALSTVKSELGGGDSSAMAAILHRLMTVYCPPFLNGGWQDQMDNEDHPLRPDIPASTFYHIYFSITCAEDYLAH
ncbi:AGE family epimerase/isomerase [Novosphingobium sp. BL-8A]|uniref:AGE family epimerase/isomerase n=1 Tax=Novosphingobium sp. BL-8A TaxID=3127639 RepID=UPI003758386E